MQDFPAALLLELLPQLTADIRRALRGRNARAELTEEAGAQDGVLWLAYVPTVIVRAAWRVSCSPGL